MTCQYRSLMQRIKFIVSCQPSLPFQPNKCSFYYPTTHLLWTGTKPTCFAFLLDASTVKFPCLTDIPWYAVSTRTFSNLLFDDIWVINSLPGWISLTFAAVIKQKKISPRTSTTTCPFLPLTFLFLSTPFWSRFTPPSTLWESIQKKMMDWDPDQLSA